MSSIAIVTVSLIVGLVALDYIRHVRTRTQRVRNVGRMLALAENDVAGLMRAGD